MRCENDPSWFISLRCNLSRILPGGLVTCTGHSLLPAVYTDAPSRFTYRFCNLQISPSVRPMHIKSSTLLRSSSLPTKLLHRLCSSVFSPAKNVCLVPTTLSSIPHPFQGSPIPLALLLLQSQPQDLVHSLRYAPTLRPRIAQVLTTHSSPKLNFDRSQRCDSSGAPYNLRF